MIHASLHRDTQRYSGRLKAAQLAQLQADGWSVDRMTLTATPRQLRLAMVDVGIDPSIIDQMIAAMPDGIDKTKAHTEWEYALEISRSHPLVELMIQTLGRSAEDADNLFIAAQSY